MKNNHYERLDNIRAAAEERGLEVVVPGPRDVFVDLDSSQDQYVLEANGFLLTLEKYTRSEHGNKHAYLKAPRDLTDLERILLQACLGSDRKRELLSFLRVLADIRPASALFELPT